MSVNWVSLLDCLRSYPPGTHRILPPCTRERATSIENGLGSLPTTLSSMVSCFNGAELYIVGMPLVTLFGISQVPLLPPLEWAPEWYIDKYTARWRESGNRDNQWAFAMTNYGALAVLFEDGSVREWETADNGWGISVAQLDDWLSEKMKEGESLLK